MTAVNEARIACGCGRRMTLDPLRGKGSYRCGCGIRIKVELPAAREGCSWKNPDGSRCPLVAVLNGEPVLLCAAHTKDFRRMWFPEEETMMERYNRLGLVCEHCSDPRVFGEDERQRQERSVVYYVMRGGLIKIGTTANFAERMRALDPDEVLATEPGGRDLEKARHKQFAALLAKRQEWFTPGPELREHIETLKQRGEGSAA